MIPTRAAALEKLAEFLPRAGSNYASHRNFDHGPNDRSNISGLSPYLRHRLITEEEVTRAVLEKHSPRMSEKFLQEVAWRTYWKGWLEMRPTVWTDYLAELSGLERGGNYHQAIEGRTGIDCFDAWTRELIEYGFLHNHARMWLASIWIFTLKLPWQLGADFFLKYLLDADPASNTLSWRWVAGLHTPGKHYLARAENIEKYTLGRFKPIGQLDENAAPLPLDRIATHQLLLLPENSLPSGKIGHLVIPDDLSPLPPEMGHVTACAVGISGGIPPLAPLPQDFLTGSVRNYQDQIGAELLGDDFSTSVTDWAIRERLDAILMTRPTAGPWRDSLKDVTFPVPVFHYIHPWDRKLWPHATAGFFKLKKALPKLHQSFLREHKTDLFQHSHK